jgi:hypothetical protein
MGLRTPIKYSFLSDREAETSEVHSVTCGVDATLLHAALTKHNFIAAVAVQRPDR